MRKTKRNRYIPADDRGMALLITIMVVSLLIAVTVQFNKAMRQSYFSSATLRDAGQLSAVARSGLNIGTALLEVDGEENSHDSLLDSWATITETSFPGLFARGVLDLEILDYSGRLQVNSLVQMKMGQSQGEGGDVAKESREILKRLLLSGNFEIEDETQAREIVDALVDWLDADDRESDYGAETSYYQSLEPTYECRNGPVTFIEELLLVKGISPELLYGQNGGVGLANYLTVHGDDGKININTAPVELLQALHPLMTEDLAESIDEYRRVEENIEILADPTWYSNAPSWPGDIILPEKIVSSISIFFEVRSDGVFHDLRRRITAVVKRDKKNMITMVSRKVE